MQHSNMVEVDRGCTQRITVRGFVEVESVEDMMMMLIGDGELKEDVKTRLRRETTL